MAESANKIKRALISVSDKSGIVDLANALVNQFNIEIISTGGTLKELVEAGVPAIEISSFTGFPEMMDGRVKTLHPKVHGGILARRDLDQEVMQENDILPIDLVVVNLYPFAETIAKENVTLEMAIENIDIGGPSMVRSSAKNNKYVSIVVDPKDYLPVLDEMKKNDGALTQETRSSLARKAFEHTASYDSTIASYLSSLGSEDFPSSIFGKYKIKEQMRYGENPHQKAAFYIEDTKIKTGLGNAIQIQGKQLSYNNIADTDAAIECVRTFKEPSCVIVKHANPCGVASSDKDITEAYQNAFESDPTSAFGGIIAINRKLDGKTALRINDNQFVEVIVAPGIDEEAKEVLAKKENIRLLDLQTMDDPVRGYKFMSVTDGLLMQETDNGQISEKDFKIVTKRQPTKEEIKDCLFAWKVCKFVKSNAIIFAKDNQTIGIGAGQMSRIDSTQIAASKAKERGFETKGCSMASDAFFPFRDGIDAATAMGISSIIQPGGSIRDDEVIEAADEANVAMIFTGMRHFRH
ncbi:MAG: bifunctional phosphoribosylaminoimidazolecarboxamide formyltransferase/IMP cyclohydrolase [Pseudomonadota bacterium]|nr:bifunctional phosphoribosylaminoimidazolecarboxamide formyltransferase/IMP cyclohydrolase [Pseudomonadota bacterium]